MSRRSLGLSVVMLGMAVLVACGPGAAPSPTPLPPSPTPIAISPEEEGYSLYFEVGCAACHGENAEGGIGPALAGHAREQVIAQVRNPLGTMPAYSLERLSDEDLDKIAAYIVSLGPATAGHMHGEFETTEPEAAHLVLAFRALKGDNVADAIHHLEHSLEIAGVEGRASYEAIVADLQAGHVHDAEHDIEDLLSEAELGLSSVRLHLRLALDALAIGDAADAEHHLGHAIEISEEDAERATLQELLGELRAGEMHRVEDGIREMLGMEHVD